MTNKIPNTFATDIFNIDYQNLKNKGITTLFFDLDNTLIPYDVKILTKEVKDLLNKLSQDFKILIITNNNQKRTQLAIGSDFMFLAGARKPFKCGLRKGLTLTSSTPNQVAAIGDQVMTDVLGAKNMGFYSILVNPVDQNSEGIPTKINRWRERRVLKRIKRKNPTLFEEKFSDFNVF